MDRLEEFVLLTIVSVIFAYMARIIVDQYEDNVQLKLKLERIESYMKGRADEMQHQTEYAPYEVSTAMYAWAAQRRRRRVRN